MNELKISSHFPKGYGDLAIQSSDDVVCYFPGPILGHMSEVFRDMLSLGGSNECNKVPIKVTEPIAILELFLTHVDPIQLPPAIDPFTIEDLIRMAHKYQVTKIMRWFDQEATVQRTSKLTSDIQESFATTHPLVVLSLYPYFEFKSASRVALKELSNRDLGRLFNGKVLIHPLVQQQLFQIREARLKRYRSWIYQLTADFGGIPMKVCDRCVESKCRWIFKMMEDTQTNPCWESFICAYDHANTMTCKTCVRATWSQIYSKYIPTWKETAQREESRFPDWPTKAIDL